MTPESFSQEQQAYLQGLLLGTDVARKIRNLPVLSGSGINPSNGSAFQLGAANRVSTAMVTNDAPVHLHAIHAQAMQRFEMAGKSLVAEEKAKRDKSGLGMWEEIGQRAAKGEFPKGTDVFLTKFHGLFFVAPSQNSFMCRMRIPGGELRSDQLSGLAKLADEFAGGYADITTRANLQLREITAKNALHVLMGLRELGLVTQGSGADNVRNVTASTLSGLDSKELIETLPLAKQLHYHILHKPELYGLPRKFNIALDGSGRISSLAETNDISFHAVNLLESQNGLAAGVYFLLGLGGITGHGDFARSTGILVESRECIAVSEAILRVFIAYGNRTDRKKARLKYLLDEWGFDRFLAEVEKEYKKPLHRVASNHWEQPDHVDRWAHVDVHPQQQVGYSYIGLVLPVGRITSEQCRGIASIASRYGSGTVRLTVWQNLIIPNVRDEDMVEVQESIEGLGLGWSRNGVRAGLVACTGSAGCKFAGADTKKHSMILAEYLEDRFELDQPINIHVTGCHHSCAQHAIGDIGLLATKVTVGEDMVDGYHILVGGRTGLDPAIGLSLFESIEFSRVPAVVESIIDHYVQHRMEDESFAEFSQRTDWKSAEFVFRTFESLASARHG
ncbi:MAG: NirA family protein [Pirellula sp.]